MHISKNLPENLDDLGVLQSLLPKSVLQRKTEDLVAGPKRGKGIYVRQKQTFDTIKSRFMISVSIDPVSKCWNWTQVLAKNGYGGFYCLVKKFLAHRISWMLHKGIIPDGLCVLHRCDNRRCVNPDHLFLGTNKDNQDDCKSKGRNFRVRGEDFSVCKLTKSSVLEIRKRRSLGEMYKDIQKDFPGISKDTIRACVVGKSWKWLK